MIAPDLSKEALDALVVQIEAEMTMLDVCAEWISRTPHGDDCYVRASGKCDDCRCGKESLIEAIKAHVQDRP